jgi:hypothetical protein
MGSMAFTGTPAFSMVAAISAALVSVIGLLRVPVTSMDGSCGNRFGSARHSPTSNTARISRFFQRG